MIKQRKIELLAPAKNLECGIEAALKRISATGGFSFLKQESAYMLKPLEKIVQ